MVGKKLVDVDISTNVGFDEDEWNFFGEDKLGEEVVVFTPVKEIMNDHFGVSTNFGRSYLVLNYIISFSTELGLQSIIRRY